MALTPDIPCSECGARAGEFCSPDCPWRPPPRPRRPKKPDTPCSVCGLLTYTGPGSRPADQRICRPCRRERTTVTVSCAVCDEPFDRPRRGSPRKTCSTACTFILRITSRGERPCVDCGVAVSDVRLRCEDCRAVRARATSQTNNRRRRAAKRNVTSEPYTLAEIAARDGHRCQLCRRKVDMSLTGSAPKAPSIDHVVPLVDGGDDTRANVQLAHFGCNSRKGARGSQQLALVG